VSERDRNRASGFSQGLVRAAARRAPLQLAQRLEEEWLADLLCRRGRLSRLRFGVACCWAVYRIAREHGTAPAAAATSAAGEVAAAYAGFDWRFLSRRTLVLLSVLVQHVVLIYGLMNGSGKVFVTHAANVPWPAWRIAGFWIAAAAYILFVAAYTELGCLFTVQAKATTLLYSLIRRAMYVFGALMILGFIVATGRPWLLLLLAIPVLLLQVVRRRK
jgi:protein-S-isoprenylcysteine O-methyltransferase Ste14